MYELYDILCLVIVFAPSLFLTIAGYTLQSDKYWRRVWEKLGKPEVENLKELKALVRSGYPRLGSGHRGEQIEPLFVEGLDKRPLTAAEKAIQK